MGSKFVSVLLCVMPLTASVLASEVPLAAVARRRPVPQPTRWWSPACVNVKGFGAVSFTRDEGRTLSSTQPLTHLGYTYGLTALETPNTLMAVHNNLLLRSDDAGCSWNAVSEISGIDFPPYLAAAGDLVYGWSDNRNTLFRVADGEVLKLTSPVDAIIGFGVNRENSNHIRVGGYDKTIRESTDGGITWNVLGGVRSDPPFMYRFAFDPQDLDHIFAGTAVKGGSVSRDGGQTWRSSTGLADGINVFNAVISPVDGNVVWAMGLNLAEADAGVPSHGRHIYRSIDGGENFSVVVDASPDITLTNGPIMAAHPTNPNVLYFVFGSYFGGYGTDLYRYDASTGQVTTTHNDHDDINSIVFSPADPSVMYLGLTEESTIQ